MLRFAVVAILTAAAAAPLESQLRITGTVRDDATDVPVAGTYVEIFDDGWRRIGGATTDSLGTFRLALRRHGRYYIRSRRIGYREVTTPALQTSGSTAWNVEVRLRSDAVLLAPLTVVARTRRTGSPVHDNFNARARTGLGTYYSRGEIEELKPRVVSDLILRHPGFHMMGSGMRRQLTSSRTSCPVQVYVDGFLLTPPGGAESEGLTLDEAVLPHDVEGIEIYRGFATVPAEFMSPQAECGVIAVWTRRGPAR